MYAALSPYLESSLLRDVPDVFQCRPFHRFGCRTVRCHPDHPDELHEAS
jgi:hypothetical protein